MKLTFLGTGSILPSRRRFSSGMLVDINSNSECLLFDCGPGTMQKLAQAGHDVNEINHLFITHFHFDHIGDYFPILLSRGVKKTEEADKLNVYGPKGIDELTEKVFEIPQLSYMKEHSSCIKINTMGTAEIGRLKVSCVPAIHPNAIAYKIDAGKVVVYTGDTEPSEVIINFAKNADLLIHECSYPEGHVEGHTTADELGEVAEKANVKKLVLNHLYPVCNGKEDKMISKIKERFDGEILIPEDLMTIEV